MRLSIADPPYLGCGVKHYGHQHNDAADYDDPATHLALLRRLVEEFDGWVLACHTPGLSLYLPHVPSGVRTGVWAKPSAGGSRPNVRVGYNHEFVLFQQPPGRRGGRAHMSRTDTLVCSPMRRTGVVGAKPPKWTRWVLDLLGFRPGEDELVDMFPGSGLVAAETERYVSGCEACGLYLTGRRSDARFCSARCRVAAHRIRNAYVA